MSFREGPVDVNLLERWLRPDVAAMDPYTPIVPFEVLSRRLGLPPERIIKLDANENPYGPSPRVRDALARYDRYHVYPDPEQRLLREALTRYVEMPFEQILVGHGSDELIDLLMRLFLEPGDRVVNCPPTFGMYAFDTAINQGKLVNVPRRTDFSLDLGGIEAAVTGGDGGRPAKLLFLCSPNNPDGSVVPASVLRRLLDLPLIIVLDEAYAEFAGQSYASWVREHPNLVVLRTFSKWAGLAGLRVGYGLFPRWMMPHLWKVKQPYNVNVAGTVAALASLEDIAYLQENVARIVAERERLYQALRSIPYLEPYPSQANFVLCRVVGRDAQALKRSLEREGILVRYFDKPGLQDHIRISVGKPEETDRLLEALGARQAVRDRQPVTRDRSRR